jgi:hypothetical protein
VRAAVHAGSNVRIAATFAGSRYLERRLKRWHNTTARVCPICRVRRAAIAAAGPPNDSSRQVPGPTVCERS